MKHDDAHYMQLALDICRQGVLAGQSPFGACIVSHDGEVLAQSHNHVRLLYDATAHAEVTAIRLACSETKDVHLPGSTIYSTTEPCPMCFTAIHWARIDRIVYGCSIADAEEFGFNELCISNQQLKELGETGVAITPHFMRDEARALFQLWQDRGGVAY